MTIRLFNINKSFGKFRALKGVTLKLEEGKVTALLGPSGSGKTTLLRLIAGLENPDPCLGSEISFYDENMSGCPAGKRGIGFVFQHYALFKHMTVFENIAFGIRVKPRRERPDSQAISKK